MHTERVHLESVYKKAQAHRVRCESRRICAQLRASLKGADQETGHFWIESWLWAECQAATAAGQAWLALARHDRGLSASQTSVAPLLAAIQAVRS
jgi:hypothetical protein